MDPQTADSTGTQAALEQASFLPEALQAPTGRSTVNSIALEPLAWHVALVLAVYGLTVTVMPIVREWLPPKFMMPAFLIAMLLGWIVQSALIEDALRAGASGKTRVDLLVQNQDVFRTLSLSWSGGARYPRLERITGSADLLAAIAKPRGGAP